MKIGFIGTGNMGMALMKGYLAAKPEGRDSLYAYDRDTAKLETLSEELGFSVCKDAREVATQAEYVLFAVKPHVIADVIQEIGDSVDWSKKIIISIAAGITMDFIEFECKDLMKAKGTAARVKVIRVMPNTPALVGCGMSALARNTYVSDAEFQEVFELFSSIGKAEEVEEKLMDAVVGVSGSSPAYVYLFIEALADGAVLQGMDRKKAYIFAAQSVLGAAAMVLETGMHPGELKDMVCSPGGTTIEAVEKLEAMGLRSAVNAAVRTAAEKSRAMRK